MNHCNILLTLMTKTHGSGDLGLAHIPASKEQTETPSRSSDPCSFWKIPLEKVLGSSKKKKIDTVFLSSLSI